jgi:hypothetical protein
VASVLLPTRTSPQRQSQTQGSQERAPQIAGPSSAPPARNLAGTIFSMFKVWERQDQTEAQVRDLASRTAERAKQVSRD